MIRASSLPGYADCARRWAARAMQRQLADAGFAVRELPPGIGAATGTATHAGAARVVYQNHNSDPSEIGIETLHNVIADGVIYDDTSPNLADAEKQVVRQIAAYDLGIARSLPGGARVEELMTATTASGAEITGHADVILDDQGTIRDLKTGRVSRANGAQYGCYSLLHRSTGGHCTRLVEDYVRRVPVKKAQPPAVSIEYDVAVAERTAKAIIKRIIRDVAEFNESGEPDAFVANPQSMMCGDKYCPAHGTRFCQEWKR